MPDHEVNCCHCPILNDSPDEGLFCSLGYKIRSKFNGGGFYPVSKDCKLTKIVYIDSNDSTNKETEFTPEKEN